MRKRLPEEVSGGYRGIPELVDAMDGERNIKYTDLSLLKEKQLKERIAHEIKSGTVANAYPDSPPEMHNIRKSLKTWFKANKWWFLANFCTTLLCSTIWLLVLRAKSVAWVWLWVWLWWVWIGQIWAFCIGKTTGSRMLVVLFFSIVGGLVIGTAAAAVARQSSSYGNGSSYN